MRITWWGHATLTLELGGVRFLTDPALTRRLAHLVRVGSPLPADEARSADAVLISHQHADHLHLPSLRLVTADAVVAPAGATPLVRRGRPQAQVRELRPGAELRVGPVTVRAVPAAHDGRRLPGSRHHGPALGYVLEHAGTRVWFAGDTGLFHGMRGIGPVDVAVVPVGGWGPTLGPHHLDPEQAADAVAAVGARHAVPMHFGTFWPVGLRPVAPGTFRRMFVEPGMRFLAAAEGRFDAHLLQPGGSVELTDPGS